MVGDTNAIGACGSRDAALDIATWILRVEEPCGGKFSNVSDADGIVINDGCIAKESSDRDCVGLCCRMDEKHGSSRQCRVDETHFEISFIGGVRSKSMCGTDEEHCEAK